MVGDHRAHGLVEGDSFDDLRAGRVEGAGRSHNGSRWSSRDNETWPFRRHLLELLSHEPRSVSSLARELGGRRSDLADDVRHLLQSARAGGHRIDIVPARCKSCGFVFAEDKLLKPGRCPVCKGTRLYEPMIRIMSAVLLWIALSACMPAATPADQPRPAAAPRASSERVPRELVSLTNAERKKANLAPLAADPQLMRAAQIHAEQMARARKMEHVLPGATYPRLQDRVAAVDYAWQAIAENVAFGDPDPARTVTGWMGSPPHRANMLNPVYTELGTGHAVDADGRPYYVQVFGRPRR